MNWRSTKFILAGGFGIAGTVAMFMRIIDGGTYVALVTLVLGTYASADVSDKYLQAKVASR